MIRIRDMNGKILPLPPGAVSIELCSTDGKVGKLLVLGTNSVTLLDADDEMFHRFCRMVGVDSADLIELE